MRLLDSKIYKTLLLVAITIVIGTLGYILLSGYSVVDALYMTIITITTVGFGEVKPFTPEEKIFTICLILLSKTIFGYAISTFSEYLVSGKLFNHFKLKRIVKKIGDLQGHTIVCGFGRNGKQAITKLKNYNQEFVVIENNKEIVDLLEEHQILNIQGDATTDDVLIKAGIKNAANLITALPKDADNLFVVLTARQLNKNFKIISRASKESSYNKLKIAGADNVIMPDKIGGNHMASLVVTPDVIEFVDRLTVEGETTANLEEIAVDELPAKFINKTILDLDLRRKTGCTVIGLRKPNKDYEINPDASTILSEGSNLIVLGRRDQIQKLREIF